MQEKKSKSSDNGLWWMVGRPAGDSGRTVTQSLHPDHGMWVASNPTEVAPCPGQISREVKKYSVDLIRSCQQDCISFVFLEDISLTHDHLPRRALPSQDLNHIHGFFHIGYAKFLLWPCKEQSPRLLRCLEVLRAPWCNIGTDIGPDRARVLNGLNVTISAGSDVGAKVTISVTLALCRCQVESCVRWENKIPGNGPV